MTKKANGRFWLIGFLALVVSVLVGVKILLPRLEDNKNVGMVVMEVAGRKLWVEIADEPEEITQGLSGRESMEDNQGMLFVFNKPVIPSFWMKDMKFPLDMIWINEGKIVDITENVPVPKVQVYLPTYSPKEPVTQVLEVNAGWVKENQVMVGEKVSE